MDKPVKILLSQIQTKKFRHEEESILVTLFNDDTIMKLVKFIIALAVTLEIIDKFNPSVKCFPIGRTWKKSVGADGKQNKFNSVKDIRDYNYMDFINVYCETFHSDYSNHRAYLAWKTTCPLPTTTRRRRAIEADFTEEESAMTIEESHNLIIGTNRRLKRLAKLPNPPECKPNQEKCSVDLDQNNCSDVKNKTETVFDFCNSAEQRSESLVQLFQRSAAFGRIFKYVLTSMTSTSSMYDCRPRTLYYYFLSWALLVYAVLIGIGPLGWKVLFAEKIADKIRHIKAFMESVMEKDQKESEAAKRKAAELIKGQMENWNSSQMIVVGYIKVVWTIIVTVMALLAMLRGIRTDIDLLGITVCRIHNFEYAKCVAPRAGLIYFVYLFALLILFFILALSLFNFVSLVKLTKNRKPNSSFLINLLSEHLGGKFQQTLRGCCSDMMIIAHLCKKNRKLFGSNYGRIKSSKSAEVKDEQETVL